MLDPRRLRLLVMLESLTTVRAVAAAASMSPSAVSQQLSVLEGECGIPLLERHGRMIRPTPAGHALAAGSVEILDRIATAEEELRDWQGASGVVRVGTFTSALTAFVVEAAGAIEAAHEGLRVSLSELPPERIVAALARGEIDVAVVGDYGDGSSPYPAEIDKTPLVTDPLLAILPADHPLAGSPVTFDQLRDERWLLDGTDLERHVVARCRRAGLEPAVAGRISSHEPLMQAVAVGLGVTVLPSLAVEPRPNVTTSPLDPSTGRTLSLLVRPEASRRHSIVVTREALAATAAVKLARLRG
ncbi:MAG: LysR family transcriptional regulator [Actinobacteria bacterium]|nr:LysR family transcriptional regulator [Actinomycetota bacterium]